MTPQHTRRTVLGGIGAGAISLVGVGLVGAADGGRFVVTTTGSGGRENVTDAGFSIRRELAGGSVLLAEGPVDRRDEVADRDGVRSVARDYQFRFEDPVDLATPSDEHDEAAFWESQWDKHNTDVEAAHETATGDGTSVAIIDTGTDVDGHPDLPNVDADAGRLFRDGVHSGTGDVEFPADVTDLSQGTTTITDHVADDVYYHGTHVAGIAAATGDVGVFGTAPDADVLPLRVFWWAEDEDGTAILTTTTGDILTAIDHAAAAGVDAMNMSIGTPPLPPEINRTGIRVAYERVIQSATTRGSVVVVSAGNSGASLQQGGFFTVPNSTAGAMSISATGPNDELTYYSNYGTNEIDVGAPGGGYETAEKTGRTDTEWPYPTNFVLNAADPDSWIGQLFGGAQYLYVIGTSMAAPQVAGAAALVREVAPDATPRQVERAIEQGADLVDGKDEELGHGRLNAADALDADGLN